MGTYTTVDLVSAELKGITISSTSTPSSTDVETWITETENEIDTMFGRTFTSTSVSSEAVDYDGSGYLRLPYAPVISISSMTYQNYGLGSATQSTSTLTEGRDEDFLLYSDDGEVHFFGSNIPPAGKERIIWSGIVGYATVPKWVQRLATLMTAKRFISASLNSDSSKSGRSITVGSISVTSPTTFGTTYVKNLDSEIAQIVDSRISASHVYRPSRGYSRWS